MPRIITLLIEAYERWSKDGGPLLAAGVAYWVALSLIPVMVLLVSGLGFFFGGTDVGRDAEAKVMQAVSEQLSPQLARQVQSVFAEVRDKAPLSGPIGLVSLFIAGLAMFSQFDHAFDRIWSIEPKSDRGLWHSVVLSLKNRLAAFLMLLALGALVIVVFLSGAALSTVKRVTGDWIPYSEQAMWLVELGSTALLNVLAFTLIYRLIPKVFVRWTDALAGGLFAAVAWEAGRQALSHFVIAGHYTSAYGLLGTFMAVMLWAYYAVSVLFFGAEFVQAVRASRLEPVRATESQ
ncbi:YihY/virulence factor BrkB family protein [Adhaeretor mobilis]|uniref:Inner membrane protein YhjD n=1 Tax=Adhaeretor mobilis TaxID=1930276 RepID=A0A517MSR2_9BACT|nr:YihY/virulence factor BrkB family protein [Adhaeretor mobilis]QDS97926.1 Inner membrane protein YhjD [Adhaeretor mobilis]